MSIDDGVDEAVAQGIDEAVAQGSYSRPPPLRRRTKVFWLVGIVTIGICLWAFVTQVVGQQITACGVDEQGPYAQVRVNNLLGGAHEQDVWVRFSMDGDLIDDVFKTVQVPAHGRMTTVVDVAWSEAYWQYEGHSPKGEDGDLSCGTFDGSG